MRRMDIVVVGAGPAGLAAAGAAAARGKRVLLLDQGARPGGQIWRHRDESALPPVAQALLQRARHAGVTFSAEAKIVDATGPQTLIVDFRGRIADVDTDAIVIATGARERFLPFPGWTLPGVTGVGGLQALLKSGLPLSARRIVIAGTGPLLFPVATALIEADADVVLVAEQASATALAAFGAKLFAHPGKLAQAIGFRASLLPSTAYRTGTWVTRAHGEGRLRAVDVVTRSGRTRRIECDWLATSAGLVPNTELGQLLGCHLDGERLLVDDQQRTTVGNVWAAGECTGVKGDEAAVAEGEIAGCAAAGDRVGASAREVVRARDTGRRFARRLERTFAPRQELLALADDDTILCRCEDVRCGAIDPSWTQRQAKLWTRVGMGACQGAVCGPACSALFGWEPNAVRPPLGAPACGAWGAALRAGDGR